MCVPVGEGGRQWGQSPLAGVHLAYVTSQVRKYAPNSTLLHVICIFYGEVTAFPGPIPVGVQIPSPFGAQLWAPADGQGGSCPPLVMLKCFVLQKMADLLQMGIVGCRCSSCILLIKPPRMCQRALFSEQMSLNFIGKGTPGGVEWPR